MRLLLLGGSVFLGRHVVDAALARGHSVTTFTRGRHDGGLPEQVERLVGDRNGALEPLRSRTWDAVVDTSGYVPRVVRQSARLLAPSVGTYLFVSSVSVYADPSRPGLREEDALGRLADAAVEQVDGDTYGPLKALCEAEAREAFGDRAIVVRPGLIAGPLDPTDRFTYWPHRMALGGEALAPGSPDTPVQVIDARDLAAWMVALCERGAGGTFSAVGPSEPTTFGRLLAACQEAAGGRAQLVWVEDAFLTERGVQPWSDLPLWLPAGSGYDGLATVDGSRAFAAGLATRPLAETARDTLAWFRALPEPRWPRGALTREREAELLAAWKAQPKDR